MKHQAESCGYDLFTYSGYSLNAGLATVAAQAGVEERGIIPQIRERSERMVRTYIRDAKLFGCRS